MHFGGPVQKIVKMTIDVTFVPNTYARFYENDLTSEPIAWGADTEFEVSFQHVNGRRSRNSEESEQFINNLI